MAGATAADGAVGLSVTTGVPVGVTSGTGEAERGVAVAPAGRVAVGEACGVEVAIKRVGWWHEVQISWL
jgi:hypothetical protein